MKKALLNLILWLITTTVIAQNLSFDWVAHMGGPGDDVGLSMTTDALGNVYTTGYFKASTDFDPGPGTFSLYSTGIDEKNIFIQKLSTNGSLLWAKQNKGYSDDEGYSIAIDNEGNVYTTGYFNLTVDFDPSADTNYLVSFGVEDAYIQKLDTYGNLLWVKQIGGVSVDKGFSITTDDFDHVYITGYFFGTADFDPGPDTFNLSSDGASDMFILKLNINGDLIWVKQMGCGAGKSITTDSDGNVYTIGTFGGTVDFDPGPGTVNLNSTGIDMYMLKLDSLGDFLWVRQNAVSISVIGKSITIDTDGNVYTTGHFQGIADFDPGLGTINFTSAGYDDIFIQKLDTNGNLLWVKQFGGTGFDQGSSITTDVDGSVYTTGQFYNSVDFDPGPGTINLTSAGLFDIFIQKLDNNGNLLWVKQMGGNSTDQCNSISTDAMGNVYTTGAFRGISDFDPGPETFNLTWNGMGDIFVHKLSLTSLAILEEPILNKISIFPNPSQGLININIGNLTDVSINVTSINGKLIYAKENINSPIYQFELEVAPGIYILELKSKGEKQQFKLIRQ